jgi:tetratricopeptide (TPR) repeat protein
VKALQGKGFEAFYVKALVSGKVWYRVCMGRYATPREAQRDAELLKKRGEFKEYEIRRIKRSEVLGVSIALTSKAPAEAAKAKKAAPAEKKAPPVEPKAAPPEVTKSEEPAEPAEKTGQEKVGAIPLAVAPEKEERREILEPKAPLSPYESAEIDLKAGKYVEAANKFEEMIRRGQVYDSNREAVLRGLADAYYYQGEKGSSVAIEKAIENYEKLLAAYPQHKDSNADVHLRLARCYLVLNRHAEAYREFENVYTKYPDSPNVAEATFAIGVSLYRLGKYPQAIERFKEYLQKNPNGEYAKHSYFWIADSYSQLKDMDQAEIWYRDGLRRFPDRSDLPKDVLIHLGMHFFRNHQFRDAADTYFRYINLYPDGPFQRQALFMIGRSLTEMEQHPAALKVYSMLIEKYPGSKEAQECAMVMANIAVRKPDLKFPVAMLGAENVRDPVSTYNDLLGKSPQPDVEEALLFQKGYALAQQGRHKEAFDTFDAIMQQFPKGKFRPATVENLRKNAEILVDRYYVQGDYLAVSDLYFRVYANGIPKGYDARTGFKMAESLKRVGLYAQAVPFFNDLVKRSEKKLQSSILLSLAEIQYHQGRYGEAETTIHSVYKEFPGTEPRERMRAQRLLADLYARKGLTEKAVQFYGEVAKSEQTPEDPAVFYRNYGRALKDAKACTAAIGCYQSAIKHYVGDREKYPVEVASESYTGLGDCLMREGNYNQALSAYRKSLEIDPNGKQSLWTLYQMGKGHLALNDEPSANRVFSELKLKGGEAFWAGLADYSVQDHQWIGKYRKYAQRP